MGFYGIVNTAVYGFCIGGEEVECRPPVRGPSVLRASHHTPLPTPDKVYRCFPCARITALGSNRCSSQAPSTRRVASPPAASLVVLSRGSCRARCRFSGPAGLHRSRGIHLARPYGVDLLAGYWPGRPRVTSPITLAAQRTARWLPRARGSAEQAPAAHSPGQA